MEKGGERRDVMEGRTMGNEEEEGWREGGERRRGKRNRDSKMKLSGASAEVDVN